LEAHRRRLLHGAPCEPVLEVAAEPLLQKFPGPELVSRHLGVRGVRAPILQIAEPLLDAQGPGVVIIQRPKHVVHVGVGDVPKSGAHGDP